MPAWGKTLSRGEIEDIIAWLREAARQAPGAPAAAATDAPF
jgi:mono/diheme cytochrome c family protein